MAELSLQILALVLVGVAGYRGVLRYVRALRAELTDEHGGSRA